MGDKTHDAEDVKGGDKPPKANGDYGLWETMIIVFSGHIGVRTRKQREQDFAKANGLHVFIAAATYFLLVVIALIFFVRFVSASA